MLYGSLMDPLEEVRLNVRKYADEVARVLKPGGRWLYITSVQPHFVWLLLRREEVWAFSTEEIKIPGALGYHFYIMTKHTLVDGGITIHQAILLTET